MNTAKETSEITSLSAIAWQKFKGNKLAVSGLVVVLTTLLVALLGPLIRPDSTTKANDQKLELAVQKPGFQVRMLKVRKNGVSSDQSWLSKWYSGEEKLYQEIPIYDYRFEDHQILIEKYTSYELNNGEWLAYDVLDVIYDAADIKVVEEVVLDSVHMSRAVHKINGEQIDINTLDARKEIEERFILNKKFLLGTDRYGRDVLSRLMSGTLISLSVGLIAVTISILVGILLGSLAGYYRGWLDQTIMWFINVVWSIPTLLLVIAITLALGKGYWQVFVAVGLTMWVEVARVVRGQILSIREKEFIEAARALGYSDGRIIFKHILPNVLGPVIVISAANFASAILIEAGLSFLGIGAEPPQATWGKMISEHKGYIITGDAHLAIIPGLAIMILVLAFMLIGNGLRDALDTKSTPRKA